MSKVTCQNGWLGFHVVRLYMCFWCGDFFWQQTSQELTHSWTSFFIPGQQNGSRTRSNVLAIPKCPQYSWKKGRISFISDLWMTICVKLLNSSIRLIRSFSIFRFLESVQSFHRALEAPAMFFLWGCLRFSIQFFTIMRSAAFFRCSTSCSTDFHSPMDQMFLSSVFTWFTYRSFWLVLLWNSRQTVCVRNLFSRFVFDFKIKLSELFYPSGQWSVWSLKTI